MKKLVMLFMLVAMAVVAAPPEFPRQFPVYKDATGTTHIVGELTPMPVQLIASGGATATMDVVMPSVSLFGSTVADLASPTVKYLQQISSFTAGSSIFFTSSAKVWYFPVSAGVTKTATEIRLGGLSVSAGEQPPLFILNTTADIAFVPDVTSASLTVFVGEE